MDSLFGLSMTIIMWVLLGILGLAVSVVLYVVLRSRVMFLMGLRNMPRRMAQTVLIILGLMLSTLIIAAAFTTGDTVDRSLTAHATTSALRSRHCAITTWSLDPARMVATP